MLSYCLAYLTIGNGANRCKDGDVRSVPIPFRHIFELQIFLCIEGEEKMETGVDTSDTHSRLIVGCLER